MGQQILSQIEIQTKNYLHTLEGATQPADLQPLFTEDAVVISPFYGKMAANEFLKEMLEDTHHSKIALHDILISRKNPLFSAAHIYYEWVLRDKTLTTFEGVYLFNFDDEKLGLIQKLTIIYDTSKTSSYV